MNQKLNFDLVAVVGAHKRGVYLSSRVGDGVANELGPVSFSFSSSAGIVTSEINKDCTDDISLGKPRVICKIRVTKKMCIVTNNKATFRNPPSENFLKT